MKGRDCASFTFLLTLTLLSRSACMIPSAAHLDSLPHTQTTNTSLHHRCPPINFPAFFSQPLPEVSIGFASYLYERHCLGRKNLRPESYSPSQASEWLSDVPSTPTGAIRFSDLVSAFLRGECDSTSLPYLSHDLFDAEADVRVISNPNADVARFVRMRCRARSSIGRPCIVFINSLIFKQKAREAVSLVLSIDVPFILISSFVYDDSIYVVDILSSPHLILWLTKNPAGEHPKLFPLPLGSQWRHNKTAPHPNAKGTAKKDLSTCSTLIDQKLNDKRTKVMYVNLSPITSDWIDDIKLKGIRRRLLDVLSRRKIAGVDVLPPLLSFRYYLCDLRQYQYVLSPVGMRLEWFTFIYFLCCHQ